MQEMMFPRAHSDREFIRGREVERWRQAERIVPQLSDIRQIVDELRQAAPNDERLAFIVSVTHAIEDGLAPRE